MLRGGLRKQLWRDTALPCDGALSQTLLMYNATIRRAAL